tara:strand:+ start:2745 stop:2960 length:216 start_codon:yes stop_codon:yes gene_type:complete
MFAAVEESTLEADSLIRCKILIKGSQCSAHIQEGSFVLIRADMVRIVKYGLAPEDIFSINHEDLIYCTIDE